MRGKSMAASLGLAGLLAAGAWSATPAQAGRPCQDAIVDHLDFLKIAEDEVTGLKVYAVKQKYGRPTGYNAWVSLKTCRGNLIVNLSTTCRVDNAYTRGDCRFENVPQR